MACLARVARYLQQDGRSAACNFAEFDWATDVGDYGRARLFTIVMAILLPIINLNQMVG